MRGFRAVMLCSFLWGSCILDLRPDVGPLASAVENGENPASGDAAPSKPGPDGSVSTPSDASAGTEPDGAVAPVQDSGKPGPGGCSVKDSDPRKQVSFKTQLKPIFMGCRCHNPEDADPFAIMESGLTISDYDVIRKGGDNTGVKVIVAGNACDSIILQKLSETPPFGDRMPRDGPYLSLAERTLISDWIVEGARDN